MVEVNVAAVEEGFFDRQTSPPYLIRVEEGLQGRHWVGPAPRLLTDDGFSSHAQMDAVQVGWLVDRFAGILLEPRTAPPGTIRLQFRIRARWSNPAYAASMGLWLSSQSGSFLAILNASGAYDGEWFTGQAEVNAFGGGSTFTDTLTTLAAGDLLVAAQMSGANPGESESQLTQIRVTLVTDAAEPPTVFPLRQKQRNDGLLRGASRARSTSSIQYSVRQNSYR